MIVVIMVSRRVGQVTLAVSERTSCRNLNGLKAIVDMIRSVKAIFGRLEESEQPSSAQPSSRRMSRQAGSIVRGKSKPRRISAQAGRQQVRLCTAQGGKGQGTGGTEGTGWLIFLAGVAGLAPATPGFGDRCSTN